MRSKRLRSGTMASRIHGVKRELCESLESRVLFSTYVLNSLASFSLASSGQAPEGGVALDASGNLYGTTTSEGVDADGTIFEVAHGTTTATTIASFNGTNGADPLGGLVLDASGN